MPIHINVGLSKKVGQPNYSSLAASCTVQFEAGHGLLESGPVEFQQRVSDAFAACSQAVHDELIRQQEHNLGNHIADDQPPAVLPPQSNGNGNGHGNSHGNGQSYLHDSNTPNGQNGQNSHAASEKQFTYARQLAKQIQGLGLRRLEMLAQKVYGKPLVAMSSLDASGLIDTLKAIKAGEVDPEAVLKGVTP
jgi:hypothetical protein